MRTRIFDHDWRFLSIVRGPRGGTPSVRRCTRCGMTVTGTPRRIPACGQQVIGWVVDPDREEQLRRVDRWLRFASGRVVAFPLTAARVATASIRAPARGSAPGTPGGGPGSLHESADEDAGPLAGLA